MAIKRVLHLCRVQLKELMLTPTLYAFLCLLFVYFYHLNADARRLQLITGQTLNAWGYTAGVCSNYLFSFVFGLGCIALFSDLPLIRENALFESVRCSRNAWIGGRILYVLCVSAMYTLVMLTLCMLTSRGSLAVTPRWGKLLNTLANGYAFDDVNLPVVMRLSYMNAFAPAQAMGVVAAMCFGAASFIGLTILCLSLLVGRVPSLLCGSLIAVLDFVIYEKLPYRFYRISPLSFMRLEIVVNPDMPYYPTLPQAAVTITAMVLAAMLLTVAAAHRSKAISRLLLKEQY